MEPDSAGAGFIAPRVDSRLPHLKCIHGFIVRLPLYTLPLLNCKSVCRRKKHTTFCAFYELASSFFSEIAPAAASLSHSSYSRRVMRKTFLVCILYRSSVSTRNIKRAMTNRGRPSASPSVHYSLIHKYCIACISALECMIKTQSEMLNINGIGSTASHTSFIFSHVSG